jgi:large subunit ribosomal protein L30
MKLHVKLIRSTIKRVEKQKRIIAALGLKKMNKVKIHDDNPVIRGMIYKVKHLVEVTEVPDPVFEGGNLPKPEQVDKPMESNVETAEVPEIIETEVVVEEEKNNDESIDTKLTEEIIPAAPPKRGRKKAVVVVEDNITTDSTKTEDKE